MSVSMTVPQWKRGECTVDGRTVRLGPTQAELLAVLLTANPLRYLRSEHIIDAVWPGDEGPPLNADICIRVHASHLRAKGIEIDGLRCSGYRIPPHARASEPQAERLAA